MWDREHDGWAEQNENAKFVMVVAREELLVWPLDGALDGERFDLIRGLGSDCIALNDWYLLHAARHSHP